MFLPDRFAFSLLLSISLAAALCPDAVQGQATDAERTEFFERRIRPVLADRCYECHAADAKEIGGQLLLDTREGVLRGGESGPAVQPGEPDQSLLIAALRHDGPEMPPDARLPDDVIRDFERWIRDGAVDPRHGAAAAVRPAMDVEAGRDFWAFRPLVQSDPPVVQARHHVRDSLDHFVLARVEAAGLSAAAEAEQRVLVRRAYFDLTGLPPRPEEVAAFVQDDRPGAWERLIDRLLASPRFGETWARLWLDLARYAEDQAHIVGNNKALFYPNAWLYRDWVIGALNRDVPYDRFVRLQLAADLADDSEPADLAALGFMGLGPKYYRRGDPAVMADEWEDRVDVVSRGLLGLTVACARCHDHKFDPIPTEDYYGLAGVFASTEMFNKPLKSGAAKGGGQAKKPDQSIHIIRDTKPRDLPVFIRGDVTNKGDVVPRRFLSVLTSGERRFQEGSGREELVDAIFSDGRDLAARVFVNRVWGRLIGRPIVGTPSNFGSLGDRPTHPLLLDHLAAEFIHDEWSVKNLVRRIMLSHTYRQSSRASAEQRAKDPDNRLLSRMNRRRLSVEAWRDAVLSVTGRVDDVVGGTSMDPLNPDEVRRTVYTQVSRFELNSMLTLYDFPDPNNHAARRALTITPLQKLFVLNSAWMSANARALAARGEGSDEQRIARLYLLLFGRRPSPDELRLGQEFLGSAGDDAAWQRYAQVLLASNELMYLD